MGRIKINRDNALEVIWIYIVIYASMLGFLYIMMSSNWSISVIIMAIVCMSFLSAGITACVWDKIRTK